MSVTTEKFRVPFIVLINFLIVYVSAPMILGIITLVTAAQRACGKGQVVVVNETTVTEKYDVEELLDDDPDEM